MGVSFGVYSNFLCIKMLKWSKKKERKDCCRESTSRCASVVPVPTVQVQAHIALNITRELTALQWIRKSRSAGQKYSCTTWPRNTRIYWHNAHQIKYYSFMYSRLSDKNLKSELHKPMSEWVLGVLTAYFSMVQSYDDDTNWWNEGGND